MRSCKILSVIACLGLLLLPKEGAAARKFIIPPLVCAPVGPIANKAKSCDDNTLFVAAAKACQAKVDLESKKAGVDIKSLFSKNEKNAQNADFQSSEEDSLQTANALAYLIAITEKARIETYNYMEYMKLPEDETDEQEAEEVSPVPCFSDPNDALEAIAEDLDKKQVQLENAIEIAQANLKTSGQRKEKLNNEGSPAPFTKTKGVGESAPVKATSGDGAKGPRKSDISGTEKLKEKKKQ